MTKGDLIDLKRKKEFFSDYLINIDSAMKQMNESFELKEIMKNIKEDFSFANKVIQGVSVKETEFISHFEYKNQMRPFDGLGLIENSLLSAKEDYEFDKEKLTHPLTLNSFRIITESMTKTIFRNMKENKNLYLANVRFIDRIKPDENIEIIKENISLDKFNKIESFILDFKKSRNKYQDMMKFKTIIFNDIIFIFSEKNNILSKDKKGINTRFEQISFFATEKIEPNRTDEAIIKIAKGLWDELSEQDKTGNPIEINDSYTEDLFNRTLAVLSSLLTIKKKLTS